MSHERQNSDLLKATRLMGEVSLGGHDNQRDMSRSSNLMQSVPDDVLAEIFQAGTSMNSGRDLDGIDDPQRLQFPHLVSSVSRRWRDVALTSPRLWTAIAFNCRTYRTTNHEGPSLRIERSRACLLDITISIGRFFGHLSSGSTESNLQSAMDQIMPHTSRWRRFTVENLSRNLVETVVARLHTASAPHLRDFKMFSNKDSWGYIRTPTDITSGVCNRLFTGGAPSLTEARLIGPCIYTPPLTGLTYLQLGGTYQVTKEITANILRDLLTASPFLITLVLQYPDIAFPLNTSVFDIQIPSLCSLTMSRVSSRTLDFWKLFSLLSLPKLETLALAHMWQFSEPFTDVVHSHATVTTLRLVKCGCIHHSLAKSLYSSFPSIIQLDLVDSSGLVLEHPHVRNDGDLAIIWPHLESITISYPVKYETICEFINNRKEMGHPLGTVNVWSRIRRQMEVLELDYVSKSKVQYPAGLKTAIEEVANEEWEDRWEEENGISSKDADWYGNDSD